jgi:hypothetical protein
MFTLVKKSKVVKEKTPIKKNKVRELMLKKAQDIETVPQKVNVELWTKQAYLSEIGQPVGIKYAFLSTNNKQCHDWVKCRDFLHDALRNHISGKKDSIYGFTYDPASNPPLHLGCMRILVMADIVNTDEKARLEILNNGLRMIHILETHSGITPLSKIVETNHPKVFLFEGSKDWMSSTFMISLYTFIIRLGAKKAQFKTKEEFDAEMERLIKVGGDHDISYLKTAWPYMYKMLQKREELKYIQKNKKPLFDEANISLFHNYTGIVELAKQADAKKLGSGDAKLKELYDLAQYIK